MLVLAVLVAAAASTVANRLARHRFPRAIAILLIYLAILAGLVGLIVPLLADEFVLLRDNLPRDQEPGQCPARVPLRPRWDQTLPTHRGTRAGRFSGQPTDVTMAARRTSAHNVSANAMTDMRTSNL